MATPRLCSIPDCNKPSKARGYCGAHWFRWRKHGDALAGRSPNGEALRWLLDHVAYLQLDCLLWPFTTNNKGYGQIWVDERLALAHRTMCFLAHGAPPEDKPYAIHRCGKGHEGYVNPQHIEWGSPADNQRDRIRDGTTNRGRANGMSRLTESKVREIRRLAVSTPSDDLAATYGIKAKTVQSIAARRMWRWLK